MTAPEADFTMGFLLATLAGLATVLGFAFIPLVTSDRMSQDKLTAGALAFAAGVMMWVAFVDVLGAEAVGFFEGHHEHQAADGEADPVMVRIDVALFFFLGLAFTYFMDVMVDRCLGETETKEAAKASVSVELEDARAPLPGAGEQKSRSSLKRVALVAMLALTLHNFPEGLATFFDGSTGSVTVALAIAMHNIPEGAAIAIPAYQSSGSFCWAFGATFVAGLAQPAGALLGWLLMIQLGLEQVSDFIYGAMYSLTAGIMIAISLLELLPEALAASSPRFASTCAFAGFAVMEFSIVCLDLAGV